MRRENGHKKFRTAVAGALLTLAVGAGVAVIVAGGATVPTAGAAAVGNGETLAGHFALLRQRDVPAPPADLAQAVAKVPAKLGLELGGARYSPAAQAWLIPGQGWLCVAARDPDGIGMACASAATVDEGKLAFVQRDPAHDRSVIVGAAPDGDTEAQALGSDGAPVASSPVSDNAYRLEGSGVEGLTVR